MKKLLKILFSSITIFLLLFESLYFGYSVNAAQLDYSSSDHTNTSFGQENIPYGYRPYYPTGNAVTGLTGKHSGPIINHDGTKPKVFQSIGFTEVGGKGGGLTPGYAPQSYLIFPKQVEGKFGDIDLEITNFTNIIPSNINSWKKMWTSLRPVISVVYYDENNSPILTAMKDSTGNFFFPSDHMYFGHQYFYNVDGTINTYYAQNSGGVAIPKNCTSPEQLGQWCKGPKNQYKLPFRLPLSKFNGRDNLVDFDGKYAIKADGSGIMGEEISLAKLKYVKVTFSFMGAAGKDGSTEMRCGGIKNDTLIYNNTDTTGKLDDNNPLSYGFTLDRTYRQFIPQDLKPILDSDNASVKEGQVFNNGSRYSVNSVVTYLGNFRPPSTPRNQKDPTLSDLILDYFGDYRQSKAFTPNGLPRKVTVSSGEPVKVFNPETFQYEVVSGGESREYSIYRPSNGVGFTIDQLQSRRLYQNNLSLRTTFLNLGIKYMNLWPSFLQTNSQKYVTKAGILFNDPTLKSLSNTEKDVLKRSTFPLQIDFKDTSSVLNSSLTKPLVIVEDNRLYIPKDADGELYNNTTYGYRIATYESAMSDPSIQIVEIGGGVTPGVPQNEYEEITTIQKQLTSLYSHFRSTGRANKGTLIITLFDDYLGFYNDRKLRSKVGSDLVEYRQQLGGGEVISDVFDFFKDNINAGSRVDQFVRNKNYLYLYNDFNYGQLYNHNSRTNKTIESKTTEKERVLDGNTNMWEYKSTTDLPETNNVILGYLHTYIKGQFLFDDCNKLYIEKLASPNSSRRLGGGLNKGVRYEELLSRVEERKQKDNLEKYWTLAGNDGVPCGSFSSNQAEGDYKCVQGDTNGNGWKKDQVTVKYYSSGAGFGYTPYGYNRVAGNSSAFTFNIGMTNIKSPDVSNEALEKVKELGLPELVGGAPVYDWKENGPIMSYASRSSPTFLDLESTSEYKKGVLEKIKKYCTGIVNSAIYKKYYDEIIVKTSPDESKLNKVFSLLDLNTGKDSHISECLLIHQPTLNSNSTYNPNHKFYSSYYDLGAYYDAAFNDSFGGRSYIEARTGNLKNVAWAAGENLTDFGKIFNSIRTEKNRYVTPSNGIYNGSLGIGSYLKAGGFFGSIPYTTRQESSLDGIVDLDKFKINNNRSDSSISWQTFYPVSGELSSEFGIPGANGTYAIGMDLTLAAGERYLKFGSYDTDRFENGGGPGLHSIEWGFRPMSEDLTVERSNPRRFNYGPIVATIGGEFDSGTLNGDQQNIYPTTVLSGADPLYDVGQQKFFTLSTLNGNGTGGNQLTGGVKDEIKVVDRGYRTGYHYSSTEDIVPSSTNIPVYNLPGPEGNDATSFYKIDLYQLKKRLTKAYESSSDPEVKKLKKYLDSWKFVGEEKGPLSSSQENTTRLKEPITLRLIMRAPNCNYTDRNASPPKCSRTHNVRSKDGTNYSGGDNIIYITSNGITGAPVPNETKYPGFSTSLELINSKKLISLDKTSGLGTRYYKEPDSSDPNNIIKSSASTTDDEEQDLVQLRMYASYDKRELLNPRLYLQKSMTGEQGIKNLIFSRDGLQAQEGEIKTLKPSAGEVVFKDNPYYSEEDENGLPKYLKVSNLGHGAVDNITGHINIDGNEYKKTCFFQDIQEEDVVKQTLSDGYVNTYKAIVPPQYICFYANPSIDLNDPTNKRLTLAQTDQILPFVDVYLKFKAPKPDKRSEIKSKFSLMNTDNNKLDDLFPETLVPKDPKDYNNIFTSQQDMTDGAENIRAINQKITDNEMIVLGRYHKDQLPDKISGKNEDRAFVNLIITGDTYGPQGQPGKPFIELPETERINNYASSLFYDINDKDLSRPPIYITWIYRRIIITNPPNVPTTPPVPPEQDTPLRPNGDPDNPVTSETGKRLPPNVPTIVFPKIVIPEGSAPICDLKVYEGQTIGVDGSVNTGDHQLIGDFAVFAQEGIRKLVGGDVIAIEDGTVSKDIVNNKDFTYKYNVRSDNNFFSYKVKYRYCGTSQEIEQESYPVSFKTDNTPRTGGGLCHIQYTGTNRTPNLNPAIMSATNGETLYHTDNIDYRIYCKNTTSKDIYNLQVKLPTPPNLDYTSGIKDEFVPLGTLPVGDVISYETNPLDLTKHTTVGPRVPAGSTVTANLEYKYKKNVDDNSFVSGTDTIYHRIERVPEDRITITVLRGGCSGTAEYPYATTGTQRYPYLPLPGQCVATVPGSNASGGLQIGPKNKACLSVKYFRLGQDLAINDAPYAETTNQVHSSGPLDQNKDPDLTFGRGNSIWGSTNNLVPAKTRVYKSCRGRYRYQWNYIESCRNTISNSGGGDGKEGSVRSQYSNVTIDIDVKLPKVLKLDTSVRERAYSSFDTHINRIDRDTVGTKKYRYTLHLETPNWNVSESQVSNSPLQKVLKDGRLYNRTILDKPLADLRIPLLAESKGSGEKGNIKNQKNEIVSDHNRIDITYGRVHFDRRRWLAFDDRVYCRNSVYQNSGSCSRGSWKRWKSELYSDGTTTDREISTTTGRFFPQVGQTSASVCVSGPGKWIQVLNGGMYVEKTDGMKNIEHKLDPNNPGSYNINWFLTQGSNTSTPNSFFQRRPQDNIFDLDQRFTTTTCYKYDRSKNEYDYNTIVPVYRPTDMNNALSGQCPDGTYPWFYAIRKGMYGYLYEFSERQLKALLDTGINLDKDADSPTLIRNRIWTYEQQAHSNKGLVFGKNTVKEIKMSGLGNIFITKNLQNLEDKSAEVNISSNILYKNNRITTGNTPEETEGDAMAVVINGNLVIGSKVEKIEGIFFVNGDVIVEESRNLLEMDGLYVTGQVIVRRKATTNDEIDDITGSQERPVFRVTGGKKRYNFLQPRLLQAPETYYREEEVEANNTNFDCQEHGICHTGS